MDPTVRRLILIRGLVQGIGFRPYVFNLATKLRLTGQIRNSPAGVSIEIQGPSSSLEAFRHALTQNPPPLAQIDFVVIEELTPRKEQHFVILESLDREAQSTPVSPDLATCPDCFRELFDPANRRYRYPFINCTQCGPRFSIIQSLPYDRPHTTMSGFSMCAECDNEYHDPSNRRFHAQPNACRTCGPEVWFVPSERAEIAARRPFDPADWLRDEDAILETISRIARGEIVALKGLGGFHLACDASRDSAVSLLRARKQRVNKPFALMASSIEQIRLYAHVDSEAVRLLTGKERPIVLLRRRTDTPEQLLSPQVAPGQTWLGFMLTYTPLHALLVTDRPLIMTSGNRGDEPIARDNDEAFERLRSLADGLLLHNRPIEVACDDSVIHILNTVETPIRRSRGYAPLPVSWPTVTQTILAVGGELKSTFCLVNPPYAYMSQHIGDMGNLETLAEFERSVNHFQKLFRVEPVAIACDMHPGYLSSQWAEREATARGISFIPVQHHHAHAAAVMLDNDQNGTDSVICVIFDGTGYGTDGAIWGGEILLANFDIFTRFGHLKYTPLPGGDSAIKRPYRVALSHLFTAGISWTNDLPCVAAASDTERNILYKQLASQLNCVPTSSMGRLFDAVSALLGVCQTASYEGEAAIELESISTHLTQGDAPKFLIEKTAPENPYLIDPTPVLAWLCSELRQGVSTERLAGQFHHIVAEMIVDICQFAREASSINTVALSGGVFQNMLLQTRAIDGLERAGFKTLIHRRVPANDGGLALGQAAVASTRLSKLRS